MTSQHTYKTTIFSSQNRPESTTIFHSSSTGKEKDSETGYYYFGARYYNSDLSLWLSVDPMSDKYPSLSPYNYCAWNPMKLVDPNGMELDDYFSKSGKYLGSDDASTRNVRIIDEKLWNSLDKDDNGHVEHDLANSMSASFSQASSQSMSESEQLSVYQHYNPTDCNIENFGGDGKTYGMKIHFEFQKKPIIRIRLKGNSTGFKVCDHADEITNLFSHEKGHLDLYESIGHREYQSLGKSVQERIAIQTQMNDPSWGGTREKFKQDFISYGRKYGLK